MIHLGKVVLDKGTDMKTHKGCMDGEKGITGFPTITFTIPVIGIGKEITKIFGFGTISKVTHKRNKSLLGIKEESVAGNHIRIEIGVISLVEKKNGNVREGRVEGAGSFEVDWLVRKVDQIHCKAP
jgi:hypothetical protein